MPDQSVSILGAAVISAILSWVIARRRMSGTVATTDADRLWAQNEKLLGAYQEDNRHLRDRVSAQEARLAQQEQKMWELTSRERECAETSARQAMQIGRLERMLKVDIGANTEAEFGSTAGT